MLYISTFFTFFNVLLNKSNCFRTVELHVVQFIVLFQFIVLLIKLNRIFFLHILSSFARPQVKTMIVKFRLLPRKTSISGISLTFFINRQYFQYRLFNIVITWAKLLGQPYSIQITQFCGRSSKVMGKSPNHQSSFLKRCDRNSECDFSVKYEGQI